MKKTELYCDIEGEGHIGPISTREVPVMFDHDQEDGLSRVDPYFEMKRIEICNHHFGEMTKKQKLIYAQGAMGHNKYFLP